MKIHPRFTQPAQLLLLVFSLLAVSPNLVWGQAAPKGIVLQWDWDSPLQEGDLVVNELHKLLSEHGAAARNLEPSPNLDIYKGVRYLTPLKQAMKQLGVSVEVGSKHMVICPGFPHRTLFVYSYNYLNEEGFNEIHLVTDKADQVVAIQLYAANAAKVRAGWLHETPKFNTYDFINSRAKALTNARVGHRVDARYREWLVVLESDFTDPTGNVYRFTRLFLPKPLVELILFRIDKIRAKAANR
jgi:hypothetical protein